MVELLRVCVCVRRKKFNPIVLAPFGMYGAIPSSVVFDRLILRAASIFVNAIPSTSPLTPYPLTTLTYIYANVCM